MLGGPLYAVGGHDGWGYLNTVERWDTQTKQWSYVGNLQHQRSTCGVAALNGRSVEPQRHRAGRSEMRPASRERRQVVDASYFKDF